jgi:hypothetical protein
MRYRSSTAATHIGCTGVSCVLSGPPACPSPGRTPPARTRRHSGIAVWRHAGTASEYADAAAPRAASGLMRFSRWAVPARFPARRRRCGLGPSRPRPAPLWCAPRALGATEQVHPESRTATGRAGGRGWPRRAHAHRRGDARACGQAGHRRRRHFSVLEQPVQLGVAVQTGCRRDCRPASAPRPDGVYIPHCGRRDRGCARRWPQLHRSRSWGPAIPVPAVPALRGAGCPERGCADGSHDHRRTEHDHSVHRTRRNKHLFHDCGTLPMSGQTPGGNIVGLPRSVLSQRFGMFWCLMSSSR